MNQIEIANYCRNNNKKIIVFVTESYFLKIMNLGGGKVCHQDTITIPVAIDNELTKLMRKFKDYQEQNDAAESSFLLDMFGDANQKTEKTIEGMCQVATM